MNRATRFSARLLAWPTTALVLAGCFGAGSMRCAEEHAPHAPTMPPAALPTQLDATLRTPPPTTFAFRGATFTLGKDHPFPSCDAPELWLAYVRPHELRGVYCDRCAETPWCTPDSGDESGGPWSFAHSSRASNDGFWCNELEYVRHAIGAQLGVEVPNGRLAPYFGHQRWYSPQPFIRPADLPPIARENIAWIDGLLARCDEVAPRPSAADVALVDAWFAANQAGAAPLPDRLYQNCERIGEAEFRAGTRTQPYLTYSPRVPIVRRAAIACAELATPPGGRVIAVHAGAWLTGQPCSECEGHEVLHFVLDRRGRVVALASVLTG